MTDRDTGRSWLVNDARVTVGADPAAATVEGTAWQLLAWLCGRGDHGLDITAAADSYDTARRLPEFFPYG